MLKYKIIARYYMMYKNKRTRGFLSQYPNFIAIKSTIAKIKKQIVPAIEYFI